MLTGRCDPAMPLLLIVLVCDDCDRAGAPNLFPQERAPGYHRQRDTDGDRSLAPAIYGGQARALPEQ
jgi:hypothetical protein